MGKFFSKIVGKEETAETKIPVDMEAVDKLCYHPEPPPCFRKKLSIIEDNNYYESTLESIFCEMKSSKEQISEKPIPTELGMEGQVIKKLVMEDAEVKEWTMEEPAMKEPDSEEPVIGEPTMSEWMIKVPTEEEQIPLAVDTIQLEK